MNWKVLLASITGSVDQELLLRNEDLVTDSVERSTSLACPHSDQRWMIQVARNVTMADWGFLVPGHYLLHDRDSKYRPAFQHIIDDAGVTRIPPPP
jgi:hypothetical protein